MVNLVPLVSLNQSGASVIVSGTNNTGVSQFVPINATASNGFFITAWVFVQPPIYKSSDVCIAAHNRPPR